MEKDLHSYHAMDLTVSIPVMQIPEFRFSQPSCIPNFSPPISKQEVTLFHMQIAACLNRGLLSEVFFFFSMEDSGARSEVHSTWPWVIFFCHL